MTEAPATANKPTLLSALWILSQAFFWTSVSALNDFIQYVLTYPKHFVLNLMVVIGFYVMLSAGEDLNASYTLDKSSDITYDNIITLSRLNRAFTVTNSAQSYQMAGGPYWIKREAIRAILFNARKSELSIEDQAILLTIADIESGFNPLAHSNTTSACGIFQFLTPTGGEYGLTIKNCMDPWENSKAQVQHYVDNFNEKIEKQVQHLSGDARIAKIFELSYFYHHDGLYAPKQSEIVKNIVPDSSDFLFGAYKILQEESERQVVTTTFLQKVVADAKTLPAKLHDWYFDSRFYRYMLEESVNQRDQNT